MGSGAETSSAARSAASRFLRQLGAESFRVTPNPLLVSGRDPTRVVIVPHSETPAPLNAPARFKWKATVGDRVLGQGENVWPVGSPSAAPVTFDLSSAGELALDVEIEVGGERKRIRRTVTARGSGLAATRQLSNEALTSDLTALDARMATTREPKERAKVREAYESAESIAYERGLWEEPAEFEASWGVRRQVVDPEKNQWKQTGTKSPDEVVAEAGGYIPRGPGKSWSPENRSPAAMQSLQHHIDHWYGGQGAGPREAPDYDARQEIYVSAGGGGDAGAARRLTQQYLAAGPGFAEARTRLDRQVRVGTEVDPSTRAGAAAVHEQLRLSEGDAAVFRGTLRREAHRTAFDLVRDSERAIRGQLARYGLPDIPDDLTNLEGGFFGAAASQLIVAQNAEKQRPLDDRKKEQADQEQLAAAATELVQLQADIKALLTERKILTGQNGGFNPMATREHQVLFGDLEKYPSVDADSSAVPDGATLPLIDSMLGEKRRQLKVRWIELEKQHPMLAAFRDGKGTPAAGLEGMTEKGGEQQQTMVAQVLPKLRNIAKVRSKLEEGEVKPLALPQVVAVARQRLLVPPGSMRDAVVREEVEASRGQDDHWAIMALTLGIAALTAVPTGGSSFLAGMKVVGELAMLGADLWQASETLDDYQTRKAATDTDLEQAKALSDEEPSLTWLAIDLLALPLGVVGVRSSVKEAREIMRKARALRAAVKEGRDGTLLREELNRIGKERGLPEGARVGERVEREAPHDAAQGSHRAEAELSGERSPEKDLAEEARGSTVKPPDSSQGPARVTTPVDGLYESIDPAAPAPSGWTFEDVQRPDGSMRTNVTGPNGATGHVRRKYDPKKKEWVMLEAFFDKDLPNKIVAGKPMIEGKGTPLIAYLDMRLMKSAGVGYGSLQSAKLSRIQNIEAICQLEAQVRNGVDLDEAIRATHSVSYAETEFIQSGHRIAEAKVVGGERGPLGELLEHYETSGVRTAAHHDAILAKYGISRGDVVLWDYDIQLTLTPFSPGPTTP